MVTRNLERTAYEGIVAMLMSGKLSRGSVVSEMALAKGLGISRTPVRHAIRQLEAQGLVEKIPNVGTIARLPDRREIGEIFDAREAIEAHVAAAAATSISPAHLAGLEQLCDQLLEIGKGFRRKGLAQVTGEERVAWLRTDLAFHRVLLDAVGNRRLIRVYADLQLLTNTCSTHLLDEAFTPVQLVARAYREHSRIVRAIRKHRREEARQLMIAHIRRKKETILELMLRQELSGAPAVEAWNHDAEVMAMLSSLEGSALRNASRPST